MSTIRTASTPATMRTRVRSRYDGLSDIASVLGTSPPLPFVLALLGLAERQPAGRAPLVDVLAEPRAVLAERAIRADRHLVPAPRTPGARKGRLRLRGRAIRHRPPRA